MTHRFHFFRRGGVDQVSLRSGDDLLALPDLDPKLWVALAMPTRDVDVDPATLDLLDADKDQRIRVPDILAAVAWVKATFKAPGDVLHAKAEVALDAIADAKVAAAARRILGDLGKPTATSISIDDVGATAKAFADTTLNGDGVVHPGATTDPELAALITEIVGTHGGVPDRSGKDGIDADRAKAFFAEVDAMAAWVADGSSDAARRPLGDATGAAALAHAAVAAKLEDYFARCRLAAFDPRAAAGLAGQEADFLALGAQTLTTDADAIARLPLAKVDPAGRLPLGAGLNPAWADKVAAFVAAAVTPLLGAREALTAADVADVAAKLAPHAAWHAARPTGKAATLDPARLSALAASPLRGQLDALLAADKALEGEYAEIAAVEKLVRVQRDFGRVLRNFVNFADFYASQDGVFQAGTLYVDGRATALCVPVTDPAKHATLAVSSGAYLAYCDCKRGTQTRQIAAAITNGDADNLFVGRNGVFYDRKGDDWDATITKIVANPISVREAFWSPYKKMTRAIEAQINKRAADADAASTAKLDGAAATIATADKAAAKPPEVAKKMDVGTVAAIGVAIGGIGTLLVGLLAQFVNLGKWLPIGLLALLLIISGPAMLMAWLKLRSRNLGPILDSNGWAINGRAKVNVSFGAALTKLAVKPPGSQTSLVDPFADKRRPWGLYGFVVVLVALAVAWSFGKFDRYSWLPVKSHVLPWKDAPAAPAATPKPAEAPGPAAVPAPPQPLPPT